MTITREKHIDNCGNSWCDLYVSCRGHDIKLSYSTVTDIGTVYVDGEAALTGGDDLLLTVADVIKSYLDESD